MVFTVHELMETYFRSCEEQRVKPNLGVIYSFCKANELKSKGLQCIFVMRLYKLQKCDFEPLYEACLGFNESEIEAVDIHGESSCQIGGTHSLSLMFAVNEKIRYVYIQDISFDKSFLRDLCQKGLNCQVLNLNSRHFDKLNMSGDFTGLHTLILDNNHSITSFDKDCFTCMPNLKSFSVCGSNIRDLWSTVAALSKLPCLEELRFQIFDMSYLDDDSNESSSGDGQRDSLKHKQTVQPVESPLDRHKRSGDIRERLCRKHFRRYEVTPVQPRSSKSQSGFVDCRPREEPRPCFVCAMTGIDIVDTGFTYMYHRNASPICLLDHYSYFIITSLPNLKILDSLPITEIDRKEAALEYSEKFERRPYKRKQKENLVNILLHGELADKGKSQHAYSRSLCAAKIESSAWPLLRSLSVSSKNLGDMHMRIRPHQFEYHPCDSALMVIGSVDGDVVVVNHENGNVVCHISSLELSSVLGLCWLKTYPSKDVLCQACIGKKNILKFSGVDCKAKYFRVYFQFISGSDNGTLMLYDMEQAAATKGIYSGPGSFTFKKFDQLTSLHVNSTDDFFLTSGSSTDVALYDIGSGKQLQIYSHLHQERINAVKFSNHLPSVFATSSLDQEVRLWDLRQKPRPCYSASSSNGNVMVCFSPDDEYLLASADNEIQQLLTVDGRVHLEFDIMRISQSHKYTPAYYMNGKDYIITGSRYEHVVHVCCSQTGRSLRDISIKGYNRDKTMLFQSLKSDPFRDFNMSVLAAYTCPDFEPEIVKVNMLDSIDSFKEES